MMAAILTSMGNAGERRGGPGGPGGPGPGPGLEPCGGMPSMEMLAELNLSDEQMSKIKEIIKNRQVSDETSREEMKSLHEQIQALSSADEFDEAAVRKIAEQIAAGQVEEMLSMAKTNNEVLAVLTAEQRSTLAQKKSEQKAKMQNAKKYFDKMKKQE